MGKAMAKKKAQGPVALGLSFWRRGSPPLANFTQIQAVSKTLFS
jgi:hypothetical protein